MELSFFEYNMIVATLILTSMLYLSEIALPNNHIGVKNFFQKCQPYLSANNISRSRISGIFIAIYIFFDHSTMTNIELSTIVQLLIFFGLTDRLDGQIARTLGITGQNGDIIDPFYDKVYDLPLLFVISVCLSQISIWFLVITTLIIIVDCIGQKLRISLKNRSAKNIGKIKTGLKFILIILLLLLLTRTEIMLPYTYFLAVSVACFIFTLWSMGLKVIAIYQAQQKTA